MTLDKRFEFNRATLIYKCKHDLAPSYLQEGLINPNEIHDHYTRHSENESLRVPKFKTDCYKHSPIVSSVCVWNRLDVSMRAAVSIDSFKRIFKRSYLV